MKKNLSKEKNLPPIVQELEKLCRSLRYPSEVDSPISPFFNVGEFPETRLADQRTASEATVETADIDEFFGRVTCERNWHNTEDKKRVDRFRKLEAFMKSNLREISLYRIGRIRIDIYVVGIDAEGNTVGIQTNTVET